MLTTISLNKLQLSENNARKTNRDEDIASLADDIAASGLKQNLVVTHSECGRGMYDVDAGGRRFLALQLLAEQKRIPKNYPVSCLVEPRENALETSLSENLHRVAMNPADEFEAFATIIGRYQDAGITDRREQVANCARRFGKEVRYVEERLRLAALAPEILEALRSGEIGLDSAKAYAAYPDQKLQLQVYAAQCKSNYNAHSVHSIRSAMAGKVYRKGDRQVRYVGLAAYQAAGGRIELELFMGSEDEEVLLDTALVDRLCREQAEADADKIAQELGYAAGAVKPWAGASWTWPKTPAGYCPSHYGARSLSAEEKTDAILVCRIKDDGTGLEPTEDVFKKIIETPTGGAPAARGPESEIERLARIRREKIELKAAHLAVPSVAGTPLEGRAFWPSPEQHWIEPIEELDDGTVRVAMIVVVPKAEVEAVMAAAERAIDQEEAVADAARAAEQRQAGQDEDRQAREGVEEEHDAEEEAEEMAEPEAVA
ncbi:MAG TPA: ParB N-terminal domain-containing protein [Allosphingosinicella sp.]|uniref:ParB/RepB/Spo0J family partition protein n=1 Tax=Allosphingosinicella sp. TaxID=2823234 RepID=UPI002EDA8C1D